MSVDQRLREGLRANSEQLVVSTEAAYDRVITRASRRRVRSRVAAVALAAAGSAAMVLVVQQAPWDGAAPPPVVEPASTVTEGTPLPATAEGTWQTGPLRASVVVANLGDHGLGRWSAAWLAGRAPTDLVTYSLKLSAGQLTLTQELNGVSQGIEDSQMYTLSGHRITLRPIDATCASLFDWAVSADQLTLAFVSDDCPPYRGTPDEVFMRALYTSAPFTATTH